MMDTRMDMGPLNTESMVSQPSTTPSPSTGMSMSMSTIFSTNTRVTLFFTEWTTTTILGYLATIACLFLLTLINRFLSALRFQMERKWSMQVQDRGLSLTLPSNSSGLNVKPSLIRPHLLQADDSETEPLNSPVVEESSNDWDASEKEQETRRLRWFSFSRMFSSWQPSGRWSITKDGLRALLEFTRAFIGYIL